MDNAMSAWMLHPDKTISLQAYQEYIASMEAAHAAKAMGREAAHAASIAQATADGHFPPETPPTTANLYGPGSIVNIDPFVQKSIQPMHPGWPIQDDFERDSLEHEDPDCFVFIFAHSGMNYATHTYKALPPGISLKTILTQDVELDSGYLAYNVVPQIIKLFARTGEELSLIPQSLFYFSPQRIANTIVDGIKDDLLKDVEKNPDNYADPRMFQSFFDSTPFGSIKPGLYSERIFQFSGWKNDSSGPPFYGAVLCFAPPGTNLDLLPGVRIHDGDRSGGIGCVSLYHDEIAASRGQFEMSQTNLLTELINVGFKRPIIINIGCNTSIGLPPEFQPRGGGGGGGGGLPETSAFAAAYRNYEYRAMGGKNKKYKIHTFRNSTMRNKRHTIRNKRHIMRNKSHTLRNKKNNTNLKSNKSKNRKTKIKRKIKYV